MNRQQRVKIGDCLSSWLTLNGSIPQGSWLGPFSFIVLIDSLQTSCPSHKYVDDTTLTELLSRNQSSCMDVYFNELQQWSQANHMLINEQKTKEMMITSSQPHASTVPKLLNIERVNVCKLLGSCVSSDLKWNHHVNYVYKTANFATAEMGSSLVRRHAIVLYCSYYYYYYSLLRRKAATIKHTNITIYNITYYICGEGARSCDTS